MRNKNKEENLKGRINVQVKAKFHRVSKVLIMEDFPHNVAGKTLKREMKKLYWEDQGINIL